ncbi:unnamed protein product [Cylicocyclus nassatus]|uniref:G-protein coupled receptors family 1 profile domain-containing protein n=1 Tax=Cylicocyclus nassatus TaxID=53992 RepID=A0AA36GJW0_CYLNA|nr:unnamed protein product [Cylicocyclus nassatus]
MIAVLLHVSDLLHVFWKATYGPFSCGTTQRLVVTNGIEVLAVPLNQLLLYYVFKVYLFLQAVHTYRNRMYLTAFDLGYIIFVTTSGTLSIVANSFLLYMIIRKSPTCLSPYRIFLGNTALTQLLYSFVMLMIEPRMLVNELNIVVIYLGPAQFLGPWACYILFITMLHYAVNSFVSIMLSMVFRCISVLTLGFPSSGAYIMCFIGYIVPMTMVLGALNMDVVSDPASNNAYINYSVANLELYRTVVGTTVDQACNMYVIMCTSIFFIPMYIVMYFCRWKIYRVISRPTFVQNNSTKSNIQKLVKALTFQALIPLFTVFPASLSYLLAQFGPLHFQLYSYFIVSSLSISALVDPMVTIYYVSPYRRYARNRMGFPRSQSEFATCSRPSVRKLSSNKYARN